jgi:hypothetical protein
MYMVTSGCGCGSGDDLCAVLPPEFVRVRYYYGQRLGVMELNDQAVYHEGKHAFHNARLHGVGVVCGLLAERYPKAAAPTTVLRVSRGVGLDPCGREVVVGVDQCIDMAAWLTLNKNRPELVAWLAGATHQLTVAVRYRECPSDPAVAPRDPCGCDNGGCEMGRIREGFELSLLTPAEAGCATQVFPERAAMVAAGGDAAAIAGLVAKGCPDLATDAWLCLATVDVVLDANQAVTDLGPIDNAPTGRATLLATSALQSLLLGLSVTASAAGAGLTGPSLGGLSFTQGATPADGTLTVGISLLSSGAPPVPDPIAAATFNAAMVTVSRFDPPGNWTNLAVAPVLVAPPAPAIDVPLPNGSVQTAHQYRLTIEQPIATPIADAQGRPLQPLRFVRQFSFVTDPAGNSQLTPSS